MNGLTGIDSNARDELEMSCVAARYMESVGQGAPLMPVTMIRTTTMMMMIGVWRAAR